MVIANLRMRCAIGIVEAVQRGLTSCAERTLSDRVGWICFELDNPAFPDARNYAASRGAFRAGRRKETRDTRDDVLIGHDIWNQLARGRFASRKRRRRSRGRGQLDERSPGYPVVHLNPPQ